jgi:ankyrin repeat protein
MRQTKNNRTPLCSAYDGGHLDIMRLLLERGAEVDVSYDAAGLLSHEASFRGRTDLVRLLSQHKAYVNARNIGNETPLHRVARAVVPWLLPEHGAFVNAQSGSHKTPIYQASELGHRDIVQLLLEHGANVHIRGEKGQTPFQVATSNGHVEVAQLLLEHGAEKG